MWRGIYYVIKEELEKVREDEKMCKALAEIMKPEIDEAFNNGFNDGFNDGQQESKILVFRNMIKDGMSQEKAQMYAEISDELAEQVLAEI